MKNPPTKYDDVIDSRDVIERIAELESDENLYFLRDSPAEQEELASLKALADEGERFADWKHGEALIRDSYFQDYAMDLAEDIGAIPHNAGWPARCIDWDQAARELQMDYSVIEFDGVTYWIRS